MSTGKRSTLRLKLLLLLALALLLTLTIAAARYRVGGERSESPPAVVARITEPIPNQGMPLEVERVTLRRHGFEPARITRPKGPFVLALDNLSELEQVEIRLLREAGNHLKTFPVSKNRVRWREAVDLNPGTYVLTEVDHPEWACRIVITPH
jgi:hypothetical protein